MKKFKEYIKLREVSATSLGKDIIGGSSSIGLDSKTTEALQAVIEAFELLLDEKPNMVINWLKRASVDVPEIQRILNQHDFDSIPDLKGAVRRAGRKLGSSIRKGLGDESNPMDHDDVLSPNMADSFKGEGYLIETAAVCARCGKEGRASIFDINAGKARCRDCGGFMNRAEPKPRKKKETKPETVQSEVALKPNYISYGRCMNCNKYFKNSSVTKNKMLCPKCIEERLSPEKKEEEKKRKSALSKERKKIKNGI